MDQEIENQRIPLYRTRIVFLTIVVLLTAASYLGVIDWILDGFLDGLLIMFFSSFLIIPVLIFDLIGNDKYLLKDTLPRRRILSWILLSVETLIILPFFFVIFLVFYGFRYGLK